MKYDQTLESVPAWLEEFLKDGGRARKLAYVEDEEASFGELVASLEERFAHEGRISPDLPEYQGFILPVDAEYVSRLRERPLYKLQYVRQPSIGEYVRAYLGLESPGDDGYVSLWLMRPDARGDVWSLASSSNACACGGTVTFEHA